MIAQHCKLEKSPVILVEGRRSLPEGVAEQLYEVGRQLAEKYPQAIFRSGNAEGSDASFADGITGVDHRRMQLVVTTPGMGRKRRHPDAPLFPLSELPQSELDILCDITCEVSPESKRLAMAACGRIKSPYLAARGRYLLRDTLKVTGSKHLNITPATFGLFYVDPANPDAGGTGHTIRVCRRFGVPVLTQLSRQSYLP